MPNPVNIPCPADAWVKVAAGVVAASIRIKSTRPNIYMQTYRVADDPAPVGLGDAIHMRLPGLFVLSPDPIDVYIRAIRADGAVISRVFTGDGGELRLEHIDRSDLEFVDRNDLEFIDR